VSVVCERGHRSETTDYCDRCGAPIAAGDDDARGEDDLRGDDDVDTSAAAPQQPCPACGAERSGDDRYCEECGFDFVSPPSTSQWEVVVMADRDQFNRYAAGGLAFPEDCEPRRFALQGTRLRIGRSRGRSGEQAPEIDLAGPSADPGVSHLHAALERRDDGSYAVRDLGSTNGTTLNDDPSPLAGEEAVPLSAGDRIRLGAWTTITVRLCSEVVAREDS
jgi:hypothetical protein